MKDKCESINNLQPCGSVLYYHAYVNMGKSDEKRATYLDGTYYSIFFFKKDFFTVSNFYILGSGSVPLSYE